MASLSPFPISQDNYHFMRVQISGHFSVQSSSAFRSRKADKPIYILRPKKIEQGKLLYPKIFPLIFLNTFQVRSSNCSRKSKGWLDKLSPKTVYPKLGFHIASKSLSPSDPSAHQCPNMFSRSSMSSFKPCRGSLLSQLLKCLKINYVRSKVNCGPHTVKLQDFWSTS